MKQTKEEVMCKLHSTCRECVKLDLLCIGKSVDYVENISCHEAGPTEDNYSTRGGTV